MKFTSAMIRAIEPRLAKMRFRPRVDFWTSANGNLYGIQKGGKSTGWYIYPDEPNKVYFGCFGKFRMIKP